LNLDFDFLALCLLRQDADPRMGGDGRVPLRLQPQNPARAAALSSDEMPKAGSIQTVSYLESRLSLLFSLSSAASPDGDVHLPVQLPPPEALDRDRTPHQELPRQEGGRN
jgi:hypothetical protein